MFDTILEQDLKAPLKEIFGFSQFRGIQETIIRNLLSGKNQNSATPNYRLFSLLCVWLFADSFRGRDHLSVDSFRVAILQDSVRLPLID